MRRTRNLAVLAAVAAVTLSACGGGDSGSGGGSSSASGDRKSYNVGLLYQLKAAEFSVRGGENMKEAADALGWKLTEIDPAGDPQKANAGLVSFATQGVDAVITTSWEPSAVRQGLLQLKQKNIPVINVWGGISSTTDITAQIAPDESNFGKVASEYLTSKLSAGDKVVALNSNAFTFGKLRWAEFQKAVAAKGVSVVGQHQTDYTNPQADTTKAITDLLNAHPDVQGIYTDSSLQVPGVAQVLKQKGLCGKVAVVGFYGDLQNLQAIRDNCYTAIADIPVQPQGWVIMDTIAHHFYDKADWPTSTPTGYPFKVLQVDMITKDNVPADPKAYFDVSFDYKSYFEKRWQAGTFGPGTGG
jgi:ribose transport system substrate-binding protein